MVSPNIKSEASSLILLLDSKARRWAQDLSWCWGCTFEVKPHTFATNSYARKWIYCPASSTSARRTNWEYPNSSLEYLQGTIVLLWRAGGLRFGTQDSQSYLYNYSSSFRRYLPWIFGCNPKHKSNKWTWIQATHFTHISFGRPDMLWIPLIWDINIAEVSVPACYAT